MKIRLISLFVVSISVTTIPSWSAWAEDSGNSAKLQAEMQASVNQADLAETLEADQRNEELASTSAPEVIAALNSSLLDVLKRSDELGYQGRKDALQPILERAFDLDFMAKMAIGRRWRKLSDENREAWKQMFKELTFANYASRFKGYSEQSFDLIGEEPGANGTKIAKTRIVNPKDDDVAIDYRLRDLKEEGWKVIDIYLKGTISEIALRRSEYGSILEREGFAALEDAVRKRVDELSEAQN